MECVKFVRYLALIMDFKQILHIKTANNMFDCDLSFEKGQENDRKKTVNKNIISNKIKLPYLNKWIWDITTKCYI